MTDAEFAQAFEDCTLAPFQHRDHVRLAWIYLHRYSEPQATDRIRRSIQAFAAHHGKTEKYNETVTRVWMRLVASRMKNAPRDFEAFLTENPDLLDKSLPSQFYSESALTAPPARDAFAPPDLRPLPE
jgi:hypothetical protein